MRLKLVLPVAGVVPAPGFGVALGVLFGSWGASGQDKDHGHLSTRGLRQPRVRLPGTNHARPTRTNVKEFASLANEAEWELLPGVTTTANIFNGTVPGPTIRVTEGDTVRVTVTNELPQETNVHGAYGEQRADRARRQEQEPRLLLATPGACGIWGPQHGRTV